VGRRQARRVESVTAQDLIDLCAQQLARYQIPTRIEFVEELPRTMVGKILRRELARMELEAREKANKDAEH